jgi:integrase
MKICRRRSRWVLDYAYEDERGKRQRVRSSFARREDAEHEAGEVRRKLSRGAYVPPTKLPTFGEVGDDWERGKEQHRPASRAQWHTHREHLNPVAQLRLDQIEVARIERLRDALSTKGLAPQTVNKILTTGAAIFALAQRRGLVERNPFALVERLRMGSAELTAGEDARPGGGPVRPEDVPTTDEVRRVLAQLAAGRDRTLILLDAGSGLRPGELFALQWSCVDLDAGQLHVRRSVSWARVPGDTGPARFRIFPPKTRAGVRTLPLVPELIHALKVWKLECRPTENDLTFPGERATPLHRSTVLRTVLYPACDRAKVRRFNLKALRHYFASSLITAAVPITRVAQLMGHSSPLVTLKVYAHWLRDQETSGIAELARALCAEGTASTTSAGTAGAATPTAARGHKMVTMKGGRSRSTS